LWVWNGQNSVVVFCRKPNGLIITAPIQLHPTFETSLQTPYLIRVAMSRQEVWCVGCLRYPGTEPTCGRFSLVFLDDCSRFRDQVVFLLLWKGLRNSWKSYLPDITPCFSEFVLPCLEVNKQWGNYTSPWATISSPLARKAEITSGQYS
jgi:hypothetical protein